jgi:predicted acyl esterase
MGGCLLNENLTWGSVLLAFSALPPDPALVGNGWRETWLARLDHAVLAPEIWLRHQSRDAYWQRGSVGDELGRIGCPVYAVGGWADAYTNAIPRLLAGLAVPCKGLVGPWGHVYPHNGTPGEPIGFLQEALRWWDQWLKGSDTGAADAPRYRAWMPEAGGAGRWVAEAVWPSPRMRRARYVLNPGRLDATAGAEMRLEWRSRQTVGAAAGDWCSFGDVGEGPADQQQDDAGSLTFDSEPLAERLEILGDPLVVLDVAVDRPLAFLAVRLNEVLPGGTSARVTYGVVNLTHRTGHERIEAVMPGRRYRVRLALNHVAHAFAAGSRLRLAISTAYWPIVWPSPDAVTLTLFTGASTLELPVRPPEDGRLEPFAEPERGPPAAYTERQPPRLARTIVRGVAGEIIHTMESTGAGRMDAIDLEMEHATTRLYRIGEDDPLSAAAEVSQRMELRRGSWAVRVACRLRFSATREAFALAAELDAFEGDDLVRSRRWTARVPRDGV